jgi:hypothetical protein
LGISPTFSAFVRCVVVLGSTLDFFNEIWGDSLLSKKKVDSISDDKGRFILEKPFTMEESKVVVFNMKHNKALLQMGSKF